MVAEIERGATKASVASALAHRFEATPAALDAAASSFLDALLAESLIVPKAAASSPNGTPHAPGPVPAARTPLSPPRLEVFTDLQDLLLLDPIHDTDETGWPHAKP